MSIHEQKHSGAHTDGSDDIQSATASQKGLATADQITKLDGVEAGAKAYWHEVTDFSTTAAGTSSITMTADLTAVIKAGMGLKFKLSGSYYYAVCSAITSNLLTIAGAPLTTGAGDLTELYYTNVQPIKEEFKINGYFADAADTNLLENDFPLDIPWTWEGTDAYLVQYSQITQNDDSGATVQPAVMPTIAGNDTLTAALSIPDGAVNKTAVQIIPANYKITNGDILELSVTAASGGTPGNDSFNLYARFLFVPELA